MSARESGRRPSPVDEWWNRAFPPFSTKRLLFLLAVYPLVGLLVEMGMTALFGRLPSEIAMGPLHGGFSWLRYAVLTVSGMALLSVLWLSGSLHRAAAAVAQDAVRPRPAPRPEPAREYRPSWGDFAIALSFGVACVLILMWSIGEPLSPITLAACAGGGALVSACVVLRNTVAAPILLSLAGGAVIGVFLMLFSMFMSGPQGVLANWAIGTGITAMFVFPAWHVQRGSRAARLDLPIWVLMTGILLLVAGAAVLIRSAE